MATPLYNIGDKFEIIKSTGCFCHAPVGGYIQIINLYSAGDWEYDGYTSRGKKTGYCLHCYGPDHIGEYIKPLKTKKGFMTKLNNMMRQLLDNDTQTLVKAGYINGDLELTEKGKEGLNTILFVANKAALVSLAQADLDAEAKE